MVSKTSFIAILCAAAGLSVGAHAAPSVRVIGGNNSYSSAAAAAGAAAAKADDGTIAARAGSLRVMPAARTTATAKPVTSSGASNATSTAGRTPGAAQRLSLGKYVGGSKTSVSTQPSGSSDLTKRLEDVEGAVNNLKIDIKEKQDPLESKTKYIIIEGDEIDLDIDELSNDLQGLDGKDGARVEIEKQGDNIVWRRENDVNGDGTPKWTTLISIQDLKGDKGDTGTPADLDNYYTKAEVAALDASLQAAINAHIADGASHVSETDRTTWDKAAQDVAGKVDIVQNDAEIGKVLVIKDFDGVKKVSATGDVYTKSEVDDIIASVGSGGSGTPLGLLAYKDKITDEDDVVEGAITSRMLADQAVERAKLAVEIQEAMKVLAPEAGSEQEEFLQRSGHVVFSYDSNDGKYKWTKVETGE